MAQRLHTIGLRLSSIFLADLRDVLQAVSSKFNYLHQIFRRSKQAPAGKKTTNGLKKKPPKSRNPGRIMQSGTNTQK